MSNEGSLQSGAASGFDLQSQQGIALLLASVRAASVSTEDKNEIRDLIFQYSNGGQDESVRLTIEQKLAMHQIQPLAGAAKTKVAAKQPSKVVKPHHPFGASRPSPSFSAPTQPASAPKAAPEEKVEPKKDVQPAPAQETASEDNKKAHLRHGSNEEPVEAFAPVEPAAAPVKKALEPIVVPIPKVVPPEPEINPAAQTASKTVPPVKVQTKTVQDDTNATAPADDAAGYSADKSLQRIREIKSLVNDKVGNPVNLVDIDNEVGREYMGALLDAMKKINSGSSAISAMKRLEAAYVAVEAAVEKHAENPQPAAEPKPTPEAKEEDQTEPAPESPKPVVPEVEPVAPTPVPPPMPETKPAPAAPVANNAPDKVEPDVASSASLPQTPPPVEDTEPAATPVPIKKAAPEEKTSEWGSEPERPKEPSRIPLTKVASLADAQKPTSIDSLPTSASIETSAVAGDNLFTKEVDDGLNQLLAEWSIFKKSGLFGTGPKGLEHPLFKKISELQIPLLLAGRFEGATQEIKQSITDYMNGWRYEQGIIYEQGETFEHYLRRVIRHILDQAK